MLLSSSTTRISLFIELVLSSDNFSTPTTTARYSLKIRTILYITLQHLSQAHAKISLRENSSLKRSPTRRSTIIARRALPQRTTWRAATTKNYLYSIIKREEIFEKRIKKRQKRGNKKQKYPRLVRGLYD